jgi:signal peptidase II
MTSERPDAPHPPSTPEEDRRKLLLYVAILVLVVGSDAVTKYIVTQNLVLYSPVPVMGDYVRLTYIYNPGAAFGLRLGAYSRYIFLVFTVVAVTMLLIWYRATPWWDKLRLVAIATVTGGAIGNFIDRVRSPRGVIDFLDIGVGATRWPVFNIADIAVTVGALMLALSLWKEEKALEEMKRRQVA